ncbi:MAG: DUF3343 domain-containing protein [Oscillospiraceae bacterium]|jgi:hypothetical protein
MDYLFVFRSLTYAQRGAKALKGAGIRASIVRSPIGVKEAGCSHSLRVPQKHAQNAAELLRRISVPPQKIFQSTEDGRFEEVSI